MRTASAVAAILLLLVTLTGCAKDRITLLADEYFAAVIAGEDGESDYGVLKRAAKSVGYRLEVEIIEFDPRSDTVPPEAAGQLEAAAEGGEFLILSPLLSSYMLMDPEESSAASYLRLLPADRTVLWLQDSSEVPTGFLGIIWRDRSQGWYAAGMYAADTHSDGGALSALCLSVDFPESEVAASFREGLLESSAELPEPFCRAADVDTMEKQLASLPGTVLLGLDTGLQTEVFLSKVQKGKVIPVGEYIDTLIGDKLPGISIRDDFAGTISNLLLQLQQQGTGTESVNSTWRIVSTFDR